MAHSTVLETKKKGVTFKIREEGQVFMLYVKEKGSNKFQKVQSSEDYRELHQIMLNQKEFK